MPAITRKRIILKRKLEIAVLLSVSRRHQKIASVSSPLSPSTTPSLFHSRLDKTHLFHNFSTVVHVSFTHRTNSTYCTCFRFSRAGLAVFVCLFSLSCRRCNYMYAATVFRWAFRPSVHSSVFLSNAWIVTKWKKLLPTFLYRRKGLRI